jgi:hypothetical protein
MPFGGLLSAAKLLAGQFKETDMPRLMQPLALAAALSAAWLITVPGASAQTQPQGQVQPQSGSTSISDQKLDATAAAIEHVASLQESYRQKLAAAPASDKERIASEANTALKKAVTDQGLSVQEYTSILEVAQNDPKVRERLLQRIHPPEK